MRLVGIVRDPTPIGVANEPAAFALTTDVEPAPGSDPDIVVKVPASDRTFFVEGEGGVVEIDPTQMAFTGGLKVRWKGRDMRGTPRTVTTDYVPVGSSVLVSGRLGAGAPGAPPRLLPPGRGPVYLVRFEPGEEPVALLRRARSLNWVTLLVLVASVGGTVLAATALNAEMPAWHYPGTPASEV